MPAQKNYQAGVEDFLVGWFIYTVPLILKDQQVVGDAGGF